MTTPMIDFQDLIEKSTDGDWLREMIGFAAERLMAIEVEGLGGAGFGERSEERTSHRNGYRDRRWETRAGAVDLKIPKLRKGAISRPFSSRGGRRKGAGGRHPGGLHPRRVDPRRRRPGQGHGHVGHLEEPGLTAVQGHRCPGEGFPGATDRGRLAVRLAGRDLPQGTPTWAHRQRGWDSRRRRQHGGTP